VEIPQSQVAIPAEIATECVGLMVVVPMCRRNNYPDNLPPSTRSQRFGLEEDGDGAVRHVMLPSFFS